MSVQLLTVETAEHLDAIRWLFRDYAQSLPIDLGYQGFEAEFDALPGAYAPPHGDLILAIHIGEAVGCIALRPFRNGAGELKRLYVKPEARGLGVGDALVSEIVRRADLVGYSLLYLDTLTTMLPAIHLYERHGFAKTEPYYETPIQETVFMVRSRIHSEN